MASPHSTDRIPELPRLLSETVLEAIGRRRRHDPVGSRTGGPAGNARVTAWLGSLLLVVLTAEAFTLLDVRGFIGWHVGFGIVLVALTLAKAASTGWRVVRYYAGSAPYRVAGPPPTLLRWLGPILVATALGVLGTGLALIALGPHDEHVELARLLGRRIDAVTLHQAFFIAFAVCVGLHVLARAVPALERLRSSEHVPGRTWRAATMGAVVAAGTLAAVLVAPSAWR